MKHLDVKPILFTVGVVILVVLYNLWYLFVDDSLILGGTRADYGGGEVIQLVDVLFFIGIGAAYLFFSFIGWVVKHGRAR